MISQIRHGIDMVEEERFQALIDRHGERVIQRLFTEGEQAYCRNRSTSATLHWAVRFAAKEAVLKALGTGLAAGMRWRDVEIESGDAGQPNVKLYGRVREVFESLGLSQIIVSLTHTDRSAVASVLLVG